MLVQQSTIGLLGRLCGYTRVLKDVLVEENIIGTLERPFRAEYYRSVWEAGTA